MLIATSNLYTHMVPKKSEDVAAATANMDKTGFLQWRNQSLHMFEVNYRWSPVVYDARGTLGLDEDDMKRLDALDKGKAGAVTWNPVDVD